MTAAEAIAAAEQEGLTLLRARNDSGFLGVYRGSSHMPWSNARPFQATLWDRWIDGRMHYLGCFATAEQAALVVADWQEGVKVTPQEVHQHLGWTKPELTSREKAPVWHYGNVAQLCRAYACMYTYTHTE